MMELNEALHEMPLAPVLRGVPLEQARGLANTLISVGITVLEVALREKDDNGPYGFSENVHPYAIAVMKEMIRVVGDSAIVIAGTVIHPDEISMVQDAGVTAALAPATIEETIKFAAKQKGFKYFPGAKDIEEARLAYNAGAVDVIKIFPCIENVEEKQSPEALEAIHRELGVSIVPSGGMSPKTAAKYLTAQGVIAIGFGPYNGPKPFQGGDTAIQDAANTSRELVKLARTLNRAAAPAR